MSEYAGAISKIALSRTLWLIVFFPLLGAAIQLVVARRTASARAASRVAIAIMGATLLAIVAHAAFLATLAGDERVLSEHLWRLVRIGQLDLNVGLAFDPLSAVACMVVAFGGAIAVMRARSDDPARAACRSIVIAAALVVVLADGFVVAIVAAEIATIAYAALDSDRRPRAIIAALIADAPIVVGVAVLFWGIGGGWVGGGYTPDLNPRFVAVHDSVSPEAVRAAARPRSSRDDDDDDDEDDRIRLAPGDGLLSLTSVPGAVVFVDEARTPILVGDRALRAPFVRNPIRGGLHTFRIHAGGGTDDYVVPRVLVDGGREIALTMLGPTLTYRTIQDELVIHADRGGATPREELGARKIGDVRVVTIACVLLFLGIAARALRSASAAIVAAFFFARISFLFPMSHPASAVVACGALALAFVVAALASRDSNGGRAIERVGIAHALIAIASMALGAHPAAIALLVVVTLALGALELSSTNVRANLFATSSLTAAPLVLAGAAWPAAAMVMAAYSSRGAAPLPGVVPFLGMVAALAATTFATWRRRAPAPSAASAIEWPRAAVAIAAVALLAGPVLIASRRLFGDRGEGFLEAWTAPVFQVMRVRFADVSIGTDAALLAVFFGTSFAAWALARRALTTAARVSSDGYEALFAQSVRRLASLTASLDRWVVDSVTHAVGGAARALAWTTARADEELVDAPVDVVASRASRSLRAARRLSEHQTLIYGLLLGAFAAVVLYSLLSAA